MDTVSIVLAVVSFAASVVAVIIAAKSESKMRAIANLEFDEKAAMMEEYESFFSQNFDKTMFERFRWDLEAMAHVAKWANDDKRKRMSTSAEKIANSNAVTSNVTKDSLDRIKKLQMEIKG